MARSIPYPAQLDFQADHHITRWRPLVQWLLAIPHLLIADALRTLRANDPHVFEIERELFDLEAGADD